MAEADAPEEDTAGATEDNVEDKNKEMEKITARKATGENK